MDHSATFTNISEDSSRSHTTGMNAGPKMWQFMATLRMGTLTGRYRQLISHTLSSRNVSNCSTRQPSRRR